VSLAADILARGGVVAIPTETVYGLGADAANPDAVRRVFAIKGRPANHPVIVHLSGVDDLPYWSRQVPRAAYLLAERYWPGPLTLVLERASRVPDAVTGGQDTVAVRAPAHPLTLDLLRRFGGGIAAPSANRFGRVSPTTAEHVRVDLGDEVDLVLDGGPCRIGLESTILALVGARPMLLRPGDIGLEALSAVLGEEIALPASVRIRAPGALAAHYAPRTPLELLSAEALPVRLVQLLDDGRSPACLALGTAPPLPPEVPCLVLPADAAAYGARLYAALRELDGAGADRILAATPPDTPAWLAIKDRLSRAARGSGA
jgi:L-threonylcarbamoyladenylate synthase